MRRLLILAALAQVLLADSPVVSQVYKCEEDKDDTAVDEAVQFINELHHHGYKFKLVSKDSRTLQKKDDSCDVVMVLTLEETVCHIVDPKPLKECEVRKTHETKVTAKCNVTICGGGQKPGIKSFSCDTEPASNAELLTICPDCPSLLPLHNPKGLESVKAAVEEFNKKSEHDSYFKLMEVGRLTSQHNPMFGQSYFAEFAIVETDCSDKVKAEERPACKPLCSQEAHHGFCQSTQLGNGNLTVECTIYNAQNTTHLDPPIKHCGHHKGHHKGPGHHERPEHGPRPGQHEKPEKGSHPGQHEKPEKGSHPGQHEKPEKGSRPGQHEHPEHSSRPGHSERKEHGTHPRSGCFIRSGKPYHRGHHGPHHGGPPHHDKGHKPTRPPHLLPDGKPTPPGSKDTLEFPFPHCHGFVKIPPSIHPICPFPPRFHERGHRPGQDQPIIERP